MRRPAAASDNQFQDDSDAIETVAPISPMAERILEAARKCFDRVGIHATKIEDIAVAAGLSRQTVYNHFSCKKDIVDHITLGEMMKLQNSLRHQLRRHTTFAAKIAEVVYLSVVIARENPYFTRLVRDMNLAAPGSPGLISTWKRPLWLRMLNSARDSGELAPDIEIDDIVSWLALSQAMLVVKSTQSSIDEDTLRRFIRRFVVEPLLTDPKETAAEAHEEIDNLRREVGALKELVIQQALELQLRKKAHPSASS